MIILQSIKIKNFRNYKGEQEIIFDDHRNIHIIVGTNGAGKTNLVNAIYWCLYGTEWKTSKDPYGILNIKVRDQLRRKPSGSSEYVEVKLIFKDKSENKIYVLSRSKKFINKDGEVVEDQEEFSGYIFERGKPEETGYTPEELAYFLATYIIPREISEFYIFDGEKLDTFFKMEQMRRVRESIEKMMEMNIIERAIEHLEKIIRDYRDKVRRMKPDLDSTLRELNKKEDEKKDIENQLKELKDEINELENKLKHVEEELLKIGSIDVRKIQQEIKDLKEKRQKLNSKLKEYRETLRDRMIEFIMYGYSYDAITSLLMNIESKVEKGEIPPAIREKFLRELLERGECICGSDLNKEVEKRKRIEKLLNQVKEPEELANLLTDGKYKLDEIIKRILEVYKDINKILMEIESTKDELEKVKNRIEALEEKLGGIDIEKVKELTELKKEIENKIIEKKAKIEDLKRRKDQLDLEIQKIKRKYDNELRKDRKVKELSELLFIAEKAKNELCNIKNNIRKRVMEKIGDITWNIFKDIYEYAFTYDGIEISEQFDFILKDKYGGNALTTTSAGTRQILAFSFMMALQEASGHFSPIIVDTPLSRISKYNRLAFMKVIGKLSQKAQMIFLMTDTEYTDDIKKYLKSQKLLGNEYMLRVLDAHENRIEVIRDD